MTVDRSRPTCPACGSVAVRVGEKIGACQQSDCRHRGRAAAFRTAVHRPEHIRSPDAFGARKPSLDQYDNDRE